MYANRVCMERLKTIVENPNFKIKITEIKITLDTRTFRVTSLVAFETKHSHVPQTRDCCTPKFSLSFLKESPWILKLASIQFQALSCNFPRKSLIRAKWSFAQ